VVDKIFAPDRATALHLRPRRYVPGHFTSRAIASTCLAFFDLLFSSLSNVSGYKRFASLAARWFLDGPFWFSRDWRLLSLKFIPYEGFRSAGSSWISPRIGILIYATPHAVTRFPKVPIYMQSVYTGEIFVQRRIVGRFVIANRRRLRRRGSLPLPPSGVAVQILPLSRRACMRFPTHSLRLCKFEPRARSGLFEIGSAMPN